MSGKVYLNVLGILTLAAVALWVASARQPAQGQEGKQVPPSVAVVDNEKVEKEYKFFQSERDRLQKLYDDRKRELEARQFLDEDEWKQLDTLLAKPNPSKADLDAIEKIIKSGESKRKEWQDLSGKVNPDEKQKALLKELGQTEKLNRSRVEAKSEDYGKQIDELRAKTLDDLFNKVKEGIGNVARQRGYSVVVLKQSVIWNADAVDVTDEVLKQLNSGKK